MDFKIIAHIHTDFTQKFGIPRQSGLVSTRAAIVFEPEYRVYDAFRGLDEFSHIWIIWQFSESIREGWSPTVRPPRLGGNSRRGVFATRSPYRPNEIGLSSVKLLEVKNTLKYGPVLVVEGADLLDNTPVFDIKPYLAYTDSHPDAICGFADNTDFEPLNVIDNGLLDALPKDKADTARQILAQDPRPGYQRTNEREYGLAFAGYEIRFSVDGYDLTVIGVIKEEN